MNWFEIERKLRDRGYKEYKPSLSDPEIVVARFQARFDDNDGKKFYINVLKYDMSFIPTNQRPAGWQQFSYEYDIHMDVPVGQDDTGDVKYKTIRLHFHSDWNVEEVEAFADNFFKREKADYSERW